MKNHRLIAVAFTILLCGCAPRLIRYMHVVVHENSKLDIVERSTESNSSQGKPLSGQRVDLPTKSILTGKNYAVTVYTPINSMPVVFLRAEKNEGTALYLRGEHVRELEKNSGMGLEGYQYSFIVDDADGDPIEFDIVDEQGALIGHEQITYELVSRGYVWVIDAV